MDHFKLVSEYQPTGDQPQAIKELVDGFKEGNQFETLLGVTGSGKTFTMANVIAQLNKPTLVLAHNKTLAAQLYSEMKEFFPENAVEYFVSYYDYYQPEAYVASTPTSKRTAPSMTKSKSCAIRQPPLCPSGGTSSSSPVCPVSIRWVTQSTTATWSSPCGPVCARSGTS